jgi:DNA-binding NarL/FixJ family response regulator
VIFAEHGRVDEDWLDAWVERAASWPMRPASSHLVLAIADAHIGWMLKRWPMSPSAAERHLRYLHAEIKAHAPELDLHRVLSDLSRADESGRFERLRAMTGEDEMDVHDFLGTLRAVEPTPVERRSFIPAYNHSSPLRAYHQDMLTMLAKGMSLPEVAEEIDLPIDTAKARIKAAARLMGTSADQTVMVAESLRRGWIPEPPNMPRWGTRPISAVQNEVLQHASHGLTMAQIGTKMGSSFQTTKARLELISNRLNARNRRPHLVAIALVNGWID